MNRLTRRSAVQLLGAAAGTAILQGCTRALPCPVTSGSAEDSDLSPTEQQLLRSPGELLPIVQHTAPNHRILRTRAHPLSNADSLAVLERRMRTTLAESKGVGLAAPQVAIGVRAVLVMLDARGTHPRVEPFVNPRIVDRSDELDLDYEGCLSVADVGGLVRRNRRVVVEYGLPGQHRLIEAQGFDARIFQHELDHLDGVLFIDRVEGQLVPKDKIKELREKLRQQHSQSQLALVHHPIHGPTLL